MLQDNYMDLELSYNKNAWDFFNHVPHAFSE
jgi:hypothetical protein